MKTEKYARRPVFVEAVQVTPANIEEVAEWCKGEVAVETKDGKGSQKAGARYVQVRVHRPMTDRQNKAFVGDWVLKAPNGFKVYTPNAFLRAFDPVSTTVERVERPRDMGPVISKARIHSISLVDRETLPETLRGLAEIHVVEPEAIGVEPKFLEAESDDVDKLLEELDNHS